MPAGAGVQACRLFHNQPLSKLMKTIKDIETLADRYAGQGDDAYSLIYDLCQVIKAQQQEIAALKPRRVGWDMEPPPRPTYLPKPPEEITLEDLTRGEIEDFARSLGHIV